MLKSRNSKTDYHKLMNFCENVDIHSAMGLFVCHKFFSVLDPALLGSECVYFYEFT